MKRLEELAKATNEYRNYLISVNEKAGERVIPSVDINAYPSLLKHYQGSCSFYLNVCKPSIFVDGAFQEIIKNSDQVKTKDLKNGHMIYWVTVEGIEFWFLEEKKS